MKSIKNKKTIEQVQNRLHALGYVDAGPVDGKLNTKGKTEASILDVRNALGLPLTPTIDARLIKALETAPKKEIPVEQSSATAAEISPRVESVKQTRWAKFWAKVAAYPSIALAATLAVIDQFDDAIKVLVPLKEFIPDVPVWVWIGGFGVVSTLLAFNINKAENAITDGYQKGTVKNDSVKPPVREGIAAWLG